MEMDTKFIFYLLMAPVLIFIISVILWLLLSLLRIILEKSKILYFIEKIMTVEDVDHDKRKKSIFYKFYHKPSMRLVRNLLTSIFYACIAIFFLPMAFIYEKTGIIKYYNIFKPKTWEQPFDMLPLLIGTFICFVLINFIWKHFFFKDDEKQV